MGRNKSVLNVFKQPGFTIVELLVVITVISILATITAISYVGVSTKAKTSVLQSDLINASRQIDMYQIENSQYPSSTSLVNNNKGIAFSSGNTLLSYTYDDAANYYCLTIKNGSIVASIKNNAPITNGYCMRNLIKNGDFSNGTTNWKTENIRGTLSVVGGVAQHTSDGSSWVQLMNQSMSTTIDFNHTVYSRVDIKPVSYPAKVLVSTGCKYVVDIVNGNYYQCGSGGYNTTYTQNAWSSFNIQYQTYGPQSTVAIQLFENGWPTLTSGMTVQFDNVVMIDLTATFGAGNEPTQAAVGTMLAKYPNKWFEGAVIVTK